MSKLHLGLGLAAVFALLGAAFWRLPPQPAAHAAVDCAKDKPTLSDRVRVEVDGIQRCVLEVRGIGSRTQILEFRAGNEPGLVKKVPGETSVSNVTIKVTGIEGKFFWDWYREVVEGRITQRNMSVILLNDQGTETRRYNLIECFPFEYAGARQVTQNAVISTEEFTFAVNRLERA